MSELSFPFVTPPRLVVGWGAATDERLIQEALRLGKRPLIVTGRSLRNNGTLDMILGNLARAGMDAAIHEGIPPEPDVEALQAAMNAAEAARADWVLAIGGGSALDIGKGAAALANTEISAQEYFAGKKPVPESGGLPILAVPTTAGTGSEATWVAVLVEPGADGKPPRKASIRGGAMMPAIALLDAQLTVSCPPTVTANSGMDAFVQAVESFTSVGANPLTDALSFDAALLTGRHLTTVYAEPADRPAREAMLLGSYMAGMALNTSRLGLVHGIAHPAGALTGAAHGLLCGLLMPAVMRYNMPIVEAKYARLAAALNLPNGDANALLRFTEQLLETLSIPTRLSAIGFKESDIDFVARESLNSGSAKANPRPVTETDTRAVTVDAF